MKWTVCIKNSGYEASLEARKLYNVLEDPKAQAIGMIRVIDESGESYLYPAEMFAPIANEEPRPKGRGINTTNTIRLTCVRLAGNAASGGEFTRSD